MIDEPEWFSGLREIVGDGELSRRDGDLLAHAYDASALANKWKKQGLRQFAPEAVVTPRSVETVGRLLHWASNAGIGVTPWGLGSAVTGAPLAAGGISLDMSAMNRVLEISPDDLVVRVEAGIIGADLEAALNVQGLTLNQSPQSLARSTVGGWLATRASGHFSSRWGGVESHVLAATIVLSDGTIVRTPCAPRAAVGPDLSQVFLGSEGTLGVIVEVVLRIYPISAARLYEAVSFGNIGSGLTAVRRIVRAGLRPFLVRLYDADETRHVRNPPANGRCVLLLGCEGVEAVAAAELAAALDLCELDGGAPYGAAAAEAWMARRFDFTAIVAALERPGGVAETIEVADFWSGILGTYLALKTALKPLGTEILGHFSHVYPQGTSLYLIVLGEAEDEARAEVRLRAIWDVAMRTCLERGASIAHHHGVGLVRLPYIDQSLDSSAVLLQRLKGAFDPAQTLCPGKLGLSTESRI